MACQPQKKRLWNKWKVLLVEDSLLPPLCKPSSAFDPLTFLLGQQCPVAHLRSSSLSHVLSHLWAFPTVLFNDNSPPLCFDMFYSLNLVIKNKHFQNVKIKQPSIQSGKSYHPTSCRVWKFLFKPFNLQIGWNGSRDSRTPFGAIPKDIFWLENHGWTSWRSCAVGLQVPTAEKLRLPPNKRRVSSSATVEFLSKFF